MFAIVKTGGKQYKAAVGDLIVVEKLDGAPGDSHELSEVLTVVDGSEVKVGGPFVKGAKVVAKIVRQGKGPKINGYNYKAKKNIRKRWGHRQPQTHLLIEQVIGG